MFTFGNKHSLRLSFLQIGLVTEFFHKYLEINNILEP